jgi:putative sterol carrier protein
MQGRITDMSLEPLLVKFRDKIKAHPEFKASVLFDMGADGIIFVDTTKVPVVLKTEVSEAGLVLTLSKDLLLGFLEGKKDPNVAYLTGKLKIKGSMGLAMKLNAFLED